MLFQVDFIKNYAVISQNFQLAPSALAPPALNNLGRKRGKKWPFLRVRGFRNISILRSDLFEFNPLYPYWVL